MTTTTSKKPGFINMLDWAVAIISLIAGVVLFFLQWPSPSIWAWLCLALGVLGVPLAWFNPMGRLQTWMLRRLVKRR